MQIFFAVFYSFATFGLLNSDSIHIYYKILL